MLRVAKSGLLEAFAIFLISSFAFQGHAVAQQEHGLGLQGDGPVDRLEVPEITLPSFGTDAVVLREFPERELVTVPTVSGGVKKVPESDVSYIAKLIGAWVYSPMFISGIRISEPELREKELWAEANRKRQTQIVDTLRKFYDVELERSLEAPLSYGADGTSRLPSRERLLEIHQAINQFLLDDHELARLEGDLLEKRLSDCGKRLADFGGKCFVPDQQAIASILPTAEWRAILKKRYFKPLVLDMPEAPKAISLRFLSAERGEAVKPSEYLSYGRPAFIELVFDRAPDADVQLVSLKHGDDDMQEVPVFRDAANPQRFLSKPIVLKKTEGGGE